MKLCITLDYNAPSTERYSCIDDDEYDGAPDAGPQLVGVGPTEKEAREDFWAQWLERQSERDVKNAVKHVAYWDSFFERLLGMKS